MKFLSKEEQFARLKRQLRDWAWCPKEKRCSLYKALRRQAEKMRLLEVA